MLLTFDIVPTYQTPLEACRRGTGAAEHGVLGRSVALLDSIHPDM